MVRGAVVCASRCSAFPVPAAQDLLSSPRLCPVPCPVPCPGSRPCKDAAPDGRVEPGSRVREPLSPPPLSFVWLGGTGAETKDQSVESLLASDSACAIRLAALQLRSCLASCIRGVAGRLLEPALECGRLLSRPRSRPAASRPSAGLKDDAGRRLFVSCSL